MQAAARVQVDTCPERMHAAVDNCPERMQAAVREMGVETAVRTVVKEAAVLTMRFFWCTRKKNIQTLFLLFFLPESLFV